LTPAEESILTSFVVFPGAIYSWEKMAELPKKAHSLPKLPEKSPQPSKAPRKMTPDICDEVYNICLDICPGHQATCQDAEDIQSAGMKIVEVGCVYELVGLLAEDIQSAVMEIPGLLEIPGVYELVVAAIQKAIESDIWTEAQLQLLALEKARTYFENMEY